MSQQLNIGSNNETSSYVLASTVIKAFQVLEFIAAHQPVQPAAVSKGLNLTRANVHRLLATLISIGYVEKMRSGYGLTFKLFQLGSTVPLNKSLRDVAKLVMNDLEQIAHENIYLNVLSEDVVIAIDEVKSPHHVILNPDVTYTYPVNSCASGKLLVGSMTDEQLDAYLASIDMKKRTERSITDRATFREEVQAARIKGYSTEILEFSPDLNSVAAPIHDQAGRVIATISISGPSMRLTESRIMDLVEDLMQAAEEITAKVAEHARLSYV